VGVRIGLLPTIGKLPAISAAERRAGIAQCYLSKLTRKLIEEEQQLSAAVMIGGDSYKAAIDTGATASFVSEEMAGNIAALGRTTRTRRQVRLADGRCGGINAQLEVEVKFGNKQVTMSLLILPGVVDSLVEPPETSRNRDKVCLTRDNNTNQEPKQWMGREKAIGSSRSTGKRFGRYYSVPGKRSGRLQHNDGNIEYGRAPDQNK